MDRLEAAFNERMDRLESSLGTLRERTAHLETTFNERMDNQDKAFGELRERMDRQESGIGDLRERTAHLDGMLDGLREAIVNATRRNAA